jgi:hypothetical protein
MAWTRSPRIFVLLGLVVTAGFFWMWLSWWFGQPRHSSYWTLDVVLGMAAFSSAIPLLVAAVAGFLVWWRKGAPVHWAVTVALAVMLVLGTLYGLALGLASG